MRTGAINFGNPCNRNAPLNVGLVSWLPVLWGGGMFGGTRMWDIAGVNHGTLTNTPVWGGSLGRPGGSGSLTFLAASTNYVNLGDITLPSAAMTLAFWLRPTSHASTHAFLSKWNNGVSSTFLIQNTFTAATLRCGITAVGTDGLVNVGDLASGIILNEWHHYIYVFDGAGADNAARLKLYRDGIGQTLSFAGTIPAALVDSSASLLIGAETSLGRYTSGQIDDVRIYNRALSADEAYLLCNASRFGYQQELNWITRSSLNSAAAATAFPWHYYQQMYGMAG